MSKHSVYGPDTAITSPEPRQTEAESPNYFAPSDRSATTRTVAIVALLLAASLVAFSRSNRSTPAVAPADMTIVAADLVSAALQAPGTRSAIASVAPRTGVVLLIRAEGVSPSEVTSWFARIVSPFAERVAGLPDDEALVVALDLVDASSYARVIRISPKFVKDPTRWTQTAAVGSASSAKVSAAAVAAPAEAAALSPTAVTSRIDPPVPGSSAPTSTIAPSADAPSAPSPAALGAAVADPGPPAAATTNELAINEDFSRSADNWKSLAGTWQASGGTYTQTDTSGFDLISRLTLPVPLSYTVEVRMRAANGPLNAGVILGQTKPGSREGATVVDLANSGGYLRWGRYAPNGGTYEFKGGATLAAPTDATDWHVLKVVVKGDTSVVFLDDKQIGDAGPIGAGAVGLVTSQAAVEFDDFKVVPA